MLWADGDGRARRPIVAIEDHLYHTRELLDAIARRAPAALSSVTVCVLDRVGPDTTASLAEMIARFPDVQFVPPADLDARDLASFARRIAALARPGGIIVQDVQLSTLPFVPTDRWWESIYIAAAVRGLFGERPPLVRFCSNKRGYDATFGKELIDAGFDPRDVMDKSAVDAAVAPTVLRLLARQFPATLRARRGPAAPFVCAVADADRTEAERDLDLLLWLTGDRPLLGGRAVATGVSLRPDAPERETWRALIDDRLAAASGVAVVEVGERLAEPGAERAELTNLAARHIHSLRARLRDPDAIVTARHAYQLASRLTVGIAEHSGI